jgi:hypothetical protein
MQYKSALAAGLLTCSLLGTAQASDATFTTRGLTIETATKAAQAALVACRKAGYQVGVSSRPLCRGAYGRGGCQEGLDRSLFSHDHHGARG